MSLESIRVEQPCAVARPGPSRFFSAAQRLHALAGHAAALPFPSHRALALAALLRAVHQARCVQDTPHAEAWVEDLRAQIAAACGAHKPAFPVVTAAGETFTITALLEEQLKQLCAQRVPWTARQWEGVALLCGSLVHMDRSQQATRMALFLVNHGKAAAAHALADVVGPRFSRRQLRRAITAGTVVTPQGPLPWQEWMGLCTRAPLDCSALVSSWCGDAERLVPARLRWLAGRAHQRTDVAVGLVHALLAHDVPLERYAALSTVPAAVARLRSLSIQQQAPRITLGLSHPPLWSQPGSAEEARALGAAGMPAEDLERASESFRRAVDPVRAAFDAGRSLFPRAALPRRVLTQAARHGVEDALRSRQLDVLRDRLELVTRLGSSDTAEWLNGLLHRVSPRHPGVPLLLETLAPLSRPMLRALLWRVAWPFPSRWELALRLLGPAPEAELHKLLQQRLRTAQVAGFLVALRRVAWRRWRAIPDETLLELCLLHLRRRSAVPTPARLLRQNNVAWAPQAQRAFHHWLRWRPNLRQLAFAESPNVTLPDLQSWVFPRRLISLQIPSVDPAAWHAWAARNTWSSAVTHAFLVGSAPLPHLAQPVPLVGGLWLQWLDKRMHAHRWMRLADPVVCCFNTSSNSFGWTRHHITELWLDPFAFAVHVLRYAPGGHLEAVGFVFGRLGHTSRGAAAILNGVYLRTQHPAPRAAVLACLEEQVCKPLGLHQVAVARRYGGRGVLPAGYQPRPRFMFRPTALLGRDLQPAKQTYDDVSDRLMTWEETGAHICWKDLTVPTP